MAGARALHVPKTHKHLECVGCAVLQQLTDVPKVGFSLREWVPKSLSLFPSFILLFPPVGVLIFNLSLVTSSEFCLVSAGADSHLCGRASTDFESEARQQAN